MRKTELTKEEIDAAARRLCEIEGLDPDVRVPLPADDNTLAMRYGPRWWSYRDDIVQHHSISSAIASIMPEKEEFVDVPLNSPADRVRAVSEALAACAAWSTSNHDPVTWSAILMEKVGDLARAALSQRDHGGDPVHVHGSAVEAAGAALALVECLYRDEWEWPTGAAE